ncbi:CHASE3 domain-containing protein, partial [Thiorhodococcus mannitoliphagus]|uniref:CHASE3 domain-containing protein n=1 Tax=Thiorhodococcus mannitoliphagus TaxID=329406 RepID=UPI001F115B20
MSNALILALMIAISVVVYLSIHSLLQNFYWVDHTHEVLAEASSIEAAAVDMETGMRGYLLAGKEEFLAPYNRGKKTFDELIDTLSKTVDDNPAQVKLLAEIRDTIDQWQTDVTQPAIELRREIGDAKTMNDMAKLVQEARGKQYFDKFRGQIATFIEREEKLMQARQAKAKTATEINELRQLAAWVDHTYEVMATAEAILAAAVDMETGMRGYLLAGRDAFLEPYNNGKERFYALVASLSKTVDDNPAQVALLKEINTTITGWIDNVVEGQLNLRREIGDAKTMDDMARLVGEEKGKVFFDKFRDQIKTFKERESALMGARMASLESTSATAVNISIFGTLFAVTMGIAIALLLISNVMKKLGEEPAVIAEITRQIAKGDLAISFDQTKMLGV